MGFAAGFQVGAQAVERGLKMRDENELKARLAEVYQAPTTGFGYTSEDMARMRQMQGAGEGAYNIEGVGAEGQVPTLRYTPTGLNLGSGDMPEAPTNFAPQQIQRYGDQAVAGQFSPTQLRGLQAQAAARAVAASGDYRGAALLQQQAEEAEFNAKYRPLQLQSMEGQIAGQAQQRNLADLQLKGLTRTETELQNASNFATFAAERPDATAAELKEAAFKQFNFTPDQWKKTVNTRLGIKEDEQKEFVLKIKDKLKGKNLTQLGELYNSDSDFDDKTDLAIVPGKNGAVTLNFIDKTTKAITGTQTFKNDAQAVEYLNKQATEPETIGSWMVNLRKAESAIDANQAQIRASDSTVSLNNARAGQIKQMNDAMATNLKNSQEAKALFTEYSSLDDSNDPGGAKRTSLINQFNMLSVKAGGTIPLGGLGGKKGSVLQTPVELKKNDDGTYTAFSKEGGRALYNTYNGEEIPLGMEVDAYRKMKEAAVKNGVGLVTGEDNGRLVLKYTGADGKFYDDPQKAKYAKPAPNAAAPAQGLDTGTKVVAPAAVPTAPTAKPTREPKEPLASFQRRLVAWDENRMAYEQYANDERVKAMLSTNASGLGNRPMVQ